MTELSPEIHEAIAAEVARVVAHRLPPQREEYHTIKETAALMRVHPDTVSHLIRDGKLAKTGEGRLTRIPRSSIDAYFTAG
jgi:excisionase family DNA binding protein